MGASLKKKKSKMEKLASRKYSKCLKKNSIKTPTQEYAKQQKKEEKGGGKTVKRATKAGEKEAKADGENDC